MWPLDALFGARGAVQIGAEEVRGVAVTRYRVTVDLAQADAAVPADIVPPSPAELVPPRQAYRETPAVPSS